MADDELGQLEKSYRTKRGYWKHGGIVGVLGYGGGVIGRYSSLPEEFPGIAQFHTVRINQTSGFFYTSKALKDDLRHLGQIRKRTYKYAWLHR